MATPKGSTVSQGAAAELLGRLKGVKRSGDGWTALCPSHEDQDPSLSVSIGRDGKVLVNCFAGCSADAVLGSVGLDWLALFPGGKRPKAAQRRRREFPKAVRKTQIHEAESTERERWPASKEPPPGLRHPTLGVPAKAWPLRDVEGRLFAVHARFEPEGKKTLRWWRDGSWSLKRAGLGSADAPLYGTEWVPSWDRSRPVFVVEGEKAADALLGIGAQALATVTGASKVPGWEPLLPLKGRPGVVVWPDSDTPGQEHMSRLASRLVTQQSIDPEELADTPPFEPVHSFQPEGLPEGGDAFEWVEARIQEGRTSGEILAELEGAVQGLPVWEAPPPRVAGVEADVWKALEDAEGADGAEPVLRELAASLADADEIAKGIAREKAIRILKAKSFQSPAALVDAVLKTAPTPGGGDEQGRALDLAQPEPWPEEIDGAALLTELARCFGRYMALPEGSATALALWTVHAHACEAADISPLLAITSPEKRCGKTRLLTLLGELVPRPLLAANITPAALFRAVEEMRPTLLVDEADTFLGGRDELRGILNSGHTRRAAFVVRAVGDKHEPRQFSTWGPKAVAMIGSLPGTLEDRSVPVPLRRKTARESVAPLRLNRTGDLEELARKAARWAEDHLEALERADPTAPAELHDRAADNWRPLLAIADAAGAPWPNQARRAAVLLAAEQEDEEASIRVRLLADLRDGFAEADGDRLFTDEILDHLHRRSESPWGEFGRNRQPLTARGLARLLRPFKIKPRDIRIGPEHRKGYLFASFAETFRRYLPAQPRQPRQPLRYGALRDPAGRDTSSAVTDSMQVRNPDAAGVVPVVAAREGPSPAESSPPAIEDTDDADGWGAL